MARYNSALASNSISGATTIGSPYNGAFTEFTGTAPYTVTLPSPGLYPGTNQTFYNATNGTITLSSPSGSFNGTGGSSASTLSVYAGNVVSVTSDGTNYIVISEDGSALTATSGTFSGVLTVQASGGVSIAPSSAGSIDNVVIGGSAKAAGGFTALTATGQVNFTANTSSSNTGTGSVVITGGLGVSGNINAASVSASLTGTIQTAAQPNITSVGTLSSLTTTGAINTSNMRVDSMIDVDKTFLYRQQRMIENGSVGMATQGGTLPTFPTVNSTSIPFGKAMLFGAYWEGIGEEYIPVSAGEVLYGEIYAYRASGATGTAGSFYMGVAQYDKDKNAISSNIGLSYFVASGATVPTTSTWTKYSGTITVPTSHTPYSGSDGGPVRYVRPYLIVNYSGGTIPTYVSGLIIRRLNISRDSGNIGVNGNLAVGATDPNIYGFGGKLLAVQGGSGYTNLVLAGDTNSGIAFGTSTARVGQITADGTNGIQFYSQGTGNGLTLTMSRSGNVGIGTAPSWPLHIATSSGGDGIPGIKLTQGSAGGTFNWASSFMNSAMNTSGKNNVMLVGYDQSANNSGYIGFNYQGAGSSSNFMTIGLYAADNLVNIRASGNVGIGTTSPSYKLQVAGTTYFDTNVQSVGTEFQYISQAYTAPGSGPREIFRVPSSYLCTNGIFSLSATRNSFVHGSMWAWTTTHNGAGQGTLTQLSSGNYTNVTVYLDVSSDGAATISVDWGATEGYQVTILKLSGGAIDLSQNGTDWTTVQTSRTRYSKATISLGFKAQNGVFDGSLSKGSGTFCIDHPLPELEETHNLVHSFIEGPQADLIYRGRVDLVNGSAEVNIDESAGMTEGTFEALCRDVQCFTTNESDWTAVRGSVTGNILIIEAESNTATSSVSWMVIGERKDKHMIDTGWTDHNGKPILEPLKKPVDNNSAPYPEDVPIFQQPVPEDLEG